MCNKKSFILIAFIGCFLCCSFSIKQKGNNDKWVGNHFIIGKWTYQNYAVGTVTLNFNENGTGSGLTDSVKTIFKFKYLISSDRILSLVNGHHPPAKYYIKELSQKQLIIEEYPFKKYRESISVYAGAYKKD